jgi:serine protease Do
MCLAALCFAPAARAQRSLADIVAAVQPKLVKIYGAGGLKGLEAYQTGFLISPEGHFLTIWSHVLDAENVTVLLHDGRRFEGELLGRDPRLDLALLKIDATDLPYFKLDDPAEVRVGARVLAFSNLYNVATGNEPVSVQSGVIGAIAELNARQGTSNLGYTGPAYFLDAMTNNPGAAGGALTDRKGRLLGILGKEVRDAQANTWINYALPLTEIRPAAVDMLAGKGRPSSPRERVRPKRAHDLASLGIALVPDVLVKTPPFIDGVQVDSPAAKAGLKPDDLLLFINGRLVPSCKQAAEELSYLNRLEDVRLTVQRGAELIEVTLQAP